MPAKRAKAGQPSPYEGREVEIARAIAARLRTGESLVQILRENRFPCFDTILEWQEKYAEIARMLQRARAQGCDALAAQCIEISDAAANSESEDKSADVQAARLQIDTRLRLLGKWDERYGDAVAVKHSGGTSSTVTVLSEERRLELVERRKMALHGQS